MALVAALRSRERAPRRPAEAAVAFALEAGQVEERRRATRATACGSPRRCRAVRRPPPRSPARAPRRRCGRPCARRRRRPRKPGRTRSPRSAGPRARSSRVTRQNGRGTCARTSISLSTSIARVGVCTRPADQAVFSLRLFSRLVSARVAFMPISQSECARQAAASASPWSSRRGAAPRSRRGSHPSVIDWSQSRRIGFCEPRCSTISRKISSPSRPASQALIT